MSNSKIDKYEIGKIVTIIIVTLYDTLGDKSIEFILNQTELTTIIAETKNLKKR